MATGSGKQPRGGVVAQGHGPPGSQVLLAGQGASLEGNSFPRVGQISCAGPLPRPFALPHNHA